MLDKGVQRLFFALWPDAALRTALESLLASVVPEHGRPVAVEDLHITLVFLGAVQLQRLACLQRAGADVSGPAPFSVRLDRVGHWRRSGILWCAPSQPPPELTQLVRRLQMALRSCGYEPEGRAYAPHVTLYRRASAMPNLAPYPVLHWPVRDFALVRSVGGAGPTRYRIVKKWSLDS